MREGVVLGCPNNHRITGMCYHRGVLSQGYVIKKGCY